MQRKALEGNRIVEPYLPARRLWDLHSNRVVPWWTINSSADVTREWLLSISHAWVDEKDRIEGRQSRPHPDRDTEPGTAVHMAGCPLFEIERGSEGGSAHGGVEAGRAHNRTNVPYEWA